MADTRGKANGHLQLFTAYGETSPFAEAYRSLRISLLGGNGTRPWSVGITGAGPRHGSTTTAANLALIVGETGMRVVLVDADLHKPSLHRFFGVADTFGLSSVLQGEARLEDALQAVAHPSSLRVLPAGQGVRNPAALLQPAALSGVFDRLRQDTDMVIVDLPSVAAAAHTAVVASMLDALLLVVRAGTAPAGADRTVHRLKGSNVVGIVLNCVPLAGYEISSYRHYSR